ncbi:MAG: class I SAM-dependent methyltransferase [Alphaproteobacteria bacterium]|jgi:SAM-dependent methyltransferase|nr:class I SAM-dependent methyltransferase [Alphaproteobacteria bacterium]MBT7943082.1 class I SAM-dependent methyltransferase [Alphaproteobacteria bacterium]
MTLETCRRRETCRLCGGKDLTLVLALMPTPPANAFVDEDAKSKPQPCFPLDVFFCETCAHVQLLDVVDPAVLFESYVYVSGTSPSFVKHFDDYASALIDRFAPATGSLVIDIGSNDGTLLSTFQKRGLRGLGIDPARDIAANATKAGIETIADFFSPDLATKIVADRGHAAIVTANNVFAHADDLSGIVEGVRTLLAPDGVFAFEVSYLADVVSDTLFDTIYHEHLAYHSVKPLETFFAAQGMRLFAVERVPSHGGSIRGMAGLIDGPHSTDGTVAALIAAEQGAGLDRAETFQTFAADIDALGQQLKTLIDDIKTEGKTIAGFGAPAKATTLMYQFGIDADTIDFIVDDSPLKQGLYSPGAHIPVVASDVLYERRPDYVLLLAWNFSSAIMDKHSAFLDSGGRFIVPLPELKTFGP